MPEEQSTPSISEASITKKPYIPTLEVGIGTIVAAVANQIEHHPGIRVILTSAAPVIGLGTAFVFRLVASLIIRAITINGAKKTCDEIQAEIQRTSTDRKGRLRELDKQMDDARATLKGLRTAKISLTLE